MDGEQLVFSSLEALDLDFVLNSPNKIPFPGFPYRVLFPILDSMRVRNSTWVYSDLYTHFIAPLFIPWENLIWLQLAVAIADKDVIANMLAQLTQLEYLHLTCVSMHTDDAEHTVYPDEGTVEEGLMVVIDEEEDELMEQGAINETLVRFDFHCQMRFDMGGFCEILCRLPSLQTSMVDGHFIGVIWNTLHRRYRFRRQIDILPHPGTALL
ncbi:hypothetical protein FBU59_000152 [Linderina macrospora]|uniref:Uncharacterized protein n=1 Tax=Linderina macrospora TaxID=4868 RepID=A0ACC1JHL6_9FUNG|nr:hypothetical protein FBU59_000152 [Linderina macrospora]